MDKIIILHGLFMHGLIMKPLANRLKKEGFDVEVISYNSRNINIELVFDKIQHALHSSKRNILVGHSLGGLLALSFLECKKPSIDVVSHLVTLASPLNGASIAQRLVELKCRKILGNSFLYGLKPEYRAWNGAQKIGSIAGYLPLGLRPVLLADKEMSDGTVSLNETKLQGMSDHIMLNCSHTSIIYSSKTVQQIKAFILHDKFSHHLN
ncbi:triacylglycerol lipase [Vibrio sp. TH_r3]|uniref:lipase family alpha/beta hydrolase n=1 Tax=Vibrio sp. TH_r3 TaxID=3082084 RepID=UPI0029535102|nr:triacylglycerol lipase [Vibrio sp. TH_r3]MDV7106284.1 triacylglycerol lipase [Vibrio sp. TH_r3]